MFPVRDHAIKLEWPLDRSIAGGNCDNAQTRQRDHSHCVKYRIFDRDRYPAVRHDTGSNNPAANIVDAALQARIADEIEFRAGRAKR